MGRTSWKTPCISPTWVLLVTGVLGETKRGPPLRGKPDIQVFSEEQKKPLTWTEHRRHVLTAAHCLELRSLGNAAKKPSLLTVVVGLHNKEWVNTKTALFFSVSSILLIFSDTTEKAQRIEIEKIHLPDGFTWKILNEQKIKDAAILELKTDAQFTPKVTRSERGNLSSFRSFPFACLLLLEAALPKITTTRLEF